MKCDTCHKEYDPTCDYNQGRCPLHPPIINTYSMRFMNLYRIVKEWLKKR